MKVDVWGTKVGGAHQPSPTAHLCAVEVSHVASTCHSGKDKMPSGFIFNLYFPIDSHLQSLQQMKHADNTSQLWCVHSVVITCVNCETSLIHLLLAVVQTHRLIANNCTIQLLQLWTHSNAKVVLQCIMCRCNMANLGSHEMTAVEPPMTEWVAGKGNLTQSHPLGRHSFLISPRAQPTELLPIRQHVWTSEFSVWMWNPLLAIQISLGSHPKLHKGYLLSTFWL